MTDMHLPSYMHFIDSHDLFQSLHVCDFNNNIKAVFLLLKINIHKVLQQKLNFFRSSLLVNSLATEAKSRESVRVSGYEEEGNYLILIQSLKSERKL